MLKPLVGHISQETAYVCDDYPYGFRLRCKIRYWLEFKKSQGFRLVSQTTNPKISEREVWNKPKASTYKMLAVMGLNEQNHITWTGVSPYQFDELQKFGETYGTYFDETQKAVCKAALVAYERFMAQKQQKSA